MTTPRPTLTQLAHQVVSGIAPTSREVTYGLSSSHLCSCSRSQEDTGPGRVEQASLHRRYDLIAAGTRAQKVPHFVMHPAEALGRVNT
jgi:hypothetical protein